MNSWFLHNALIFRHGQLRAGSILIEDGRITEFSPVDVPPSIRKVDLQGRLVSRGFVDLHTHLREPGGSSKETLQTAAAAAARGGFTTVTAMPNTTPTMDCNQSVEALRRTVSELGVKVEIAGAATVGRQGKEPVFLPALKEAGVWMVTDDGDPIEAGVMPVLLRAAAEQGMVVANHLEDPSLHGSGAFAPDMPPESEWGMLQRDLEWVKQTGCRYHAQHLSCAESVALVAEAKEQGLPVTCEVTPHHLALDTGHIGAPMGHYQMKPPLRTSADRRALVEGLATGVIDCVATDHAPHGVEKEGHWEPGMPFGVTGLETAFPVLFTELVLPGWLTLERLLQSLTEEPARIADIEPQLAVGQPADVVVIDLHGEQTVRTEDFASLGTNNPFVGRVLKGWPVLTLVDGMEVFS